jgi:uncharacterized protein YjiS (DUF1127 family)
MSTPAESLSTHSLGLTSRLVAGLSSLVRAFLAFARALSHRSDVQTLLEMDDRCLKDIGLTRDDVLGALSESLARDPSKILLVRSVARRARQRPVVIARSSPGVVVWRV